MNTYPFHKIEAWMRKHATLEEVMSGEVRLLIQEDTYYLARPLKEKAVNLYTDYEIISVLEVN